jgi:hypothetical protein
MVFLRSQGIVPPEKTLSPQLTQIDKCVQAYERYLREERALAETTIINYVPFIRGFLKDRFGKGQIALSGLRAGDVVKFVQGQVTRLHLKRAKVLTTALRSFLQYARYCGDQRSDQIVYPGFGCSHATPGRCRSTFSSGSLVAQERCDYYYSEQKSVTHFSRKKCS